MYESGSDLFADGERRFPPAKDGERGTKQATQ